MTDSRRSRALTAARIRLRSPIPRPLLDETRIDEVCAELLELYASTHCTHGISFHTERDACRLPFVTFVPKHAANCRDLNCDRSCMAAQSPESGHE